MLEDQYKFLIMSLSLLLRIRNALDKIVQKLKTYVVFGNFISKIVPFIRKCGKIS